MKRTLFHLSVDCELDVARLLLNILSQFDESCYDCSLWTSEEEVDPSTNTNNDTKAEIRDICLDN